MSADVNRLSFNSVVKCFFKACPCCKVFFLTPSGNHRIKKGIAGALCGIILSILFFKCIIVKIGLAPAITLIVGALCAIYITIGCAISSTVRCITALLIPTALGKAGRGTLRAIAVGIILAGPFANMLSNGKETVRTFTCSSALTLNLTKAKYNLLVKPFTNAITNMKADMSEIKETLNSLDDVINPITRELLEDQEINFLKQENDYIDGMMGETKHSDEIEKKYQERMKNLNTAITDNSSIIESGRAVELKYYRKLEYKCYNAVATAVANCKRIFEKSYEKCHNTVSTMAAWLLCWPMKITFVCNIASVMGGDKVCDPEEEIPSGFGQGYMYLLKAKNKIRKDYKKSNIQYTLNKPNVSLDMKTAVGAGLSIYKEFNEKLTLINTIKTLFCRIMLLVFINIIYQAHKYHSNYIEDIEFNNTYITGYFRRIDARRRAQGKYTVLPLKKIEAPFLIDPKSTKRSHEESGSFSDVLFTFVPEVASVSAIFIMDRLLYETLDLVRRHSRIDFTQTGEHEMTIKVKGTGMVANLVRSLVEGFSFKEKIDLLQSNEECLPCPNLLSSNSMIKVGLLYTGIFILIVINGYTSRLSRVFCAFFYPKREKKRILYLYNETLRRRIKYYRYMKERITERVKENKIEMETNIILMFRLKYNCFRWLRIFTFGRRRCLVCTEAEPSNSSQIICPECLGYYCAECWRDMNNVCYACHPPSRKPDYTLSSDEDGDPRDED